MPIKIINYNELLSDKAYADFFKPRKLGSRVHAQVQDIIDRVKADGDNALHQIIADFYEKGFERSNPAFFEIDKNDIKNAADKMKAEKGELYKAIEHSYFLALGFAKKQRECFTDFEAELEEAA